MSPHIQNAVKHQPKPVFAIPEKIGGNILGNLFNPPPKIRQLCPKQQPLHRDDDIK
jgi:hypothetical protein